MPAAPWDHQIFATLADLISWLDAERQAKSHEDGVLILDKLADWAVDMRPDGDELADINLVFLSPTAVHVLYARGPGISSQHEVILYVQ